MNKKKEYWYYYDEGRLLAYEVLRRESESVLIKLIHPTNKETPFMYALRLLEQYCEPIEEEDLPLLILGSL